MKQFIINYNLKEWIYDIDKILKENVLFLVFCISGLWKTTHKEKSLLTIFFKQN